MDYFFCPAMHEFSQGKSDFIDVLWRERWNLQGHNLAVLPMETALSTSVVKEFKETEKHADHLLSQQAPYFSQIRYSWRKKDCSSHFKNLSQNSPQETEDYLIMNYSAMCCYPPCLFVCSPESWPLLALTGLLKVDLGIESCSFCVEVLGIC